MSIAHPAAQRHSAQHHSARGHSTNDDRHSLHARFGATRAITEALAAPLSAEDQTVQPMPDARPTKWHLAHTTWFFETFLLKPFLPGYRPFDDRYGYLFNSYYETVGARHPRPQRGLLTRPAASEVVAYRAHVDAAMDRLLTSDDFLDDNAPVEPARTGHQPRAAASGADPHRYSPYTFSCNPLRPAYRPADGPSAQVPPPGISERAGMDRGRGGRDVRDRPPRRRLRL